jgi:RHS repeat-associated protein
MADGVRYEYDTEGQLVARELRGGARWRYVWDTLGQLIEAIRPDGVKVSFAYDALGRRISKTAGGRTTRYVWDGDELIHELVEGAPLVSWVWEPGTFALIAKSEGEKRYGVVNDHLGSPMLFTDEQGKPAWFGELDAWGNALCDVAQIDNPWRFPGQYADEETRLYYNRFRYYDPHAGRYISQDPLGLGGGLALYAYVRDPLTWIDPLGLSCKNHETGKRGERIARRYLQSLGLNILGSIKNKSGHGIDLVARDAAGKLRFFEIKATEGARAGGLNGAQRQGAGAFVWSRLERATQPRGHWRRTFDPGTAAKADALLAEIASNGGRGSIVGEFLQIHNGSGIVTQVPW